MFQLKACPKCHGDMVLRRDQYGMYELCMQCGYLKDILDESSPVSPTDAQEALGRSTRPRTYRVKHQQ